MARKPQRGRTRHRHRDCRASQWKSCFADPYGVLGVSSEDLGAKWFVRSLDSRGWISEFDLPADKQQAVMDRAAQHQLANAARGMNPAPSH